MTAFSKAILLSETQVPCIPSTQAQSPVSLGLSAIETNMKRGVSWTRVKPLDKHSCKRKQWWPTEHSARMLYLGLCYCPGKALGAIYAAHHILCWVPKWHIRTVGTIFTRLHWWGWQGIFQPGHGVPPSFVPRQPGLTAMSLMLSALSLPGLCTFRKALITIPST